MPRSRTAEEILRRLVFLGGPTRAEAAVHVELIEAREPSYADWPAWADPLLVERLRANGVERPWSHQIEAAELLYAGHHTVLATGTASGKSAGYLLPALTRLLADARGEGRGAITGTSHDGPNTNVKPADDATTSPSSGDGSGTSSDPQDTSDATLSPRTSSGTSSGSRDVSSASTGPRGDPSENGDSPDSSGPAGIPITTSASISASGPGATANSLPNAPHPTATGSRSETSPDFRSTANLRRATDSRSSAALRRGSSGRAPSGRGATVLYLAPTKALAADQARRLRELDLPIPPAVCLDGDTSGEERRWIREHGAFVLSNPDMLHYSMLPDHRRWASFLRRLTYVVIDECHGYRGVFGAHVASVIRRLRRLCAHYGADPVFALASATTADPGPQRPA
jgi:hypothetical protein